MRYFQQLQTIGLCKLFLKSKLGEHSPTVPAFALPTDYNLKKFSILILPHSIFSSMLAS
jgi:hypothetical protein